MVWDSADTVTNGHIPVQEEDLSDLIDASAILNTDDCVIQTVNVPEWGVKVHVRALSGQERDAYEESLWSQGKDGTRTILFKHVRAKLVALSVINPRTGKRIFSDRDVLALTEKRASALDRIATVAQRLAGLREADVERLAGNSESEAIGDSSSVSLLPSA